MCHGPSVNSQCCSLHLFVGEKTWEESFDVVAFYVGEESWESFFVAVVCLLRIAANVKILGCRKDSKVYTL